MSIIDIDQMVSAVNAENPCGLDLEYDPEMVSLIQEAAGKPEVQYGELITPAVLPDWKIVKKLSLSLFKRSHDLRVAIPLLRALMALNGLEGMAKGLALIHRLLDQSWHFVHPQLDPDDNMDPAMRLNALVALVDGPTLMKEFKEMAFIVLPGLGVFNLRQLEYATGEVSLPEGQTKLELSSIAASIADLSVEQMAATLANVQLAYDSVTGIDTILSSRVGASNMINLSGLIKNVKRVRDFIVEAQPAGTAGSFPSDGQAAEQASGVGAVPRGEFGNRATAPISGEIASREDVARMIDKICTYYAKYEPSSPVPLLLVRAKRLLSKSFIEIMEDLAPDGVRQIQVISGETGESPVE